MSDENKCVNEVPREIVDAANAALSQILPEKSKVSYNKAYSSFCTWKNVKGATETTETVLLAYFKELSDQYKPTTLWSQFSMLKTMLNLKEKVDIDKFLELPAFLKQKSRGYAPKKSKVFSANQIQNFLENAPDEHNLDKKVIILFGVFGALRGGELAQVTLKDVERQGRIYCIKIPKTKTMKPRSFIIPEEFTSFVEKYIALRPIKATTDKFFLNFQKGKCTVQVIGKNKIAAVPHKIAEFLNLPDPKDYTGHTFRRTSATMLVDAGGDLTMLKRHGGWKSSTVAEGYIDDSITNKEEIGSLLSKMIEKPSTSAVQRPNKSSAQEDETSNASPIDVLGDKKFTFTNCNITFNLK